MFISMEIIISLYVLILDLMNLENWIMILWKLMIMEIALLK